MIIIMRGKSKLISAFSISLLTVAGGGAVANADEVQWSDWDVYTGFYNDDEYDVLAVGAEQDDLYPELIAFHVQVNGFIESYSYGGDLFDDAIGVYIDIDNDDQGDAIIVSNNEYLDEGEVGLTDVFYNNDFVDCYVDQYYYSDVYTFRMDMDCLPLGSQFGIQGFAVDGLWEETDVVPDFSFFTVNNNWEAGNTSQPNPEPTNPTQPMIDLPTAIIPTQQEVVRAGSAPDDLVGLSAEITESVVQLSCGNAAGTGFAIDIEPSQGMTDLGKETYLVTNQHVIAGCENSIVNGTDYFGNNFTAEVIAYDVTDDVAGLITSQNLPTLDWAGERPAVGWWVGAIGNPYELRGSLTTGNVSQVNADDLVVTAALNPGNSGGPVFDREGRVLGVATAIRVDSQNIGYAGSASLICDWLVDCTGNAWQVNVNEVAAVPSEVVVQGKSLVQSGEQVELTAELRDENGNPLTNQNVSVEMNLTGFGEITSETNSFNSQGRLPITIFFGEGEAGNASLSITVRQSGELIDTSSFDLTVTTEEVEDESQQISEAATSTGFWTSRTGNNVKVYAKNFIGQGKVQFFFNGEEIAWARPENLDDPKLRVITEGHMAGASYLVRDKDLRPGKNVFEIYLNGERVDRRVASR